MYLLVSERSCSSSATLIDHIYMNNKSPFHHSDIIITNVHDQFRTNKHYQSTIITEDYTHAVNMLLSKYNIDTFPFHY